MIVKFYDNIEDSLLKFAVVISKHNGKWVFCKHKRRDTYEIPGGHRENGEDILSTAKRELFEETGLTESDISGLKLRYITQRLKNSEIRLNYYFFAELKDQTALKSTEGEIRCFKPEEIASLEMPLSAAQMLRHYFAEGRSTELLYSGATTENGMVFTPLTEF